MSRKSNLMSLLTMIMVAMLTVGFISCDGDDGNDSPEKPNNVQPVNPGVTVNDPEGTISLSMRNADNGKTYLDDIYIKNENFVGASFSSLGAVKGLGNVTIIPTSGWANQLSVIEGNGYVAYCNNQFYRIYVVSDIVGTSGGIIGSDIKYQKPFYGVNEAISIDENALTFTSNGGSQSIVFNNKNIFVFSATSNQSWCRVQKSSTYDKYFLYNAITINVDAKSTPDTDNAIVTLTTAYDKKVEIKVTRLGPEPVLELAEKETNISGAEQTFNVGITTNYTLDDLEIKGTTDWLKAEIVNGTRNMQARASRIRFIGEQEQNTTRAGSNSGDANSYYIRLTASTNYNESARNGSITISVKGSQNTQTLSIKQDGAYIKTEQNEVIFSKAGSNEQCTFTSSIKTEELNVRSSETWCKATLSQNAIIISVENNVTGLERNAIVTLYSNKSTASAEIKVTQTSGGIKFAANEIDVPESYSTRTISISSDFSKDEMKIYSDVDWCIPTITTNQSVVVECKENPTNKKRAAKVTISDLSGNQIDLLIVNQKETPIISLESSSITFSSEASKQIIKLKYPVKYTIEGKPDWCSIVTTDSTISVSVTSNLTATKYCGKITLKNLVSTANLTIVQNESEIPLFENGRGTKNDPYQIKNAEQFNNIRVGFHNTFFELISDIDLDQLILPYGNGWEPINNFSGVLNGDGHTIKGMWFKYPNTDNIGLFKDLESSTISRIKFEIGSNGIIGSSYIGCISNKANNCKFEECEVHGDISGRGNIGGFVGEATKCSYNKCSFVGTISATNTNAGGLCGSAVSTGAFYQCMTNGSIIAADNVGGLCGYIPHYSSINIENSYTTGKIDCSTKDYQKNCSGIVGYSLETTSIKNCYSIATIGNGYSCHAIVGHYGNVTNCYFAGNYNGYISCYGNNTYYNSDLGGGGYQDGETKSHSRTTAQMMQQSNYEGWDFANTWKITEGETYPTLRCFDY